MPTSVLKLSSPSYEKAKPTPSTSAKMICETEVRGEIAQVLAVTETRVASSWSRPRDCTPGPLYPRGRSSCRSRKCRANGKPPHSSDAVRNKFGTNNSIPGIRQGGRALLKNDDRRSKGLQGAVRDVTGGISSSISSTGGSTARVATGIAGTIDGLLDRRVDRKPRALAYRLQSGHHERVIRSRCESGAVAMLTCALIATWVSPASAETSVFPHTAVAGFSNASWLSLVLRRRECRGGGVRGPRPAATERSDYRRCARPGTLELLVGGRGRRRVLLRCRLYGSMAVHHLNQPVSGDRVDTVGEGLLARHGDGGVFTFGDARIRRIGRAIPLNEPIVDIEADPSGNGYRLVGADGGIFDYGDAGFYGSLPGRGIFVSERGRHGPDSKRSWLLDRSQQRAGYAFGDAPSRCATHSWRRRATRSRRSSPIPASNFGQGYRLIGNRASCGEPVWFRVVKETARHVSAVQRHRADGAPTRRSSGAYSIRSHTLPGYLVIDNQNRSAAATC